MSKEECKKILMTIQALYPNYTIEDKESTLRAWLVILQDYDYTAIETGLKIYVTTSGSAFAPSVGELITYSMKPLEMQQVDAVDAWTQLRKAISRGLYYSREEYEKLPEMVKEVVGSPAQIRSWAELETKEIDTVVWSNFKKSYEAKCQRKKDFALLPKEVRAVIQETEIKMIGG